MRTRNVLSHFGIALLVGLGAACGDGGQQESAGTTDQAAAPESAPATAPAAGGAGTAPTQVAGNLPAGVTTEMVQQGQQIFNQSGNCYTCHGQNGQGGPLAPSLVDDQWLWFESTPQLDELVTLIKTGVTTPKEYPAPMPPMGGANLSEDQLQAVSGYILHISQGQGG